MKNKPQQPIDVYSIVTNRIIEHLEKGVIPWRKSWTDAGIPQNLITHRPYRGINICLLNSLNYNQNYFLTFKQAQSLGAKIKKGEKSEQVVFWKWLENVDKETGKKEKIPFLRYYNVFNIAQCQDIPEELIPKLEKREHHPLETCEKIIEEMPQRPKIKHEKQRAYYAPFSDYVNMPKPETFITSESYYETLFHELVHSTGHESRLGRKEITRNKGFRTDDYAIEELTAEMGASYLKSFAGIPIGELENNAAYIQGWLSHLKNDKKFIVYASGQAQKATDFILNIKPVEKEIGPMEFPKYQDEFEDREITEVIKQVKREKELEKIRDSEKVKTIDLEL